jgi:hypothetical protein
MEPDELEKAGSRILEFEEIIYQAISESNLRNFGPAEAKWQTEHDHVLGWSLQDLIDSYREASVYPVQRLRGLVDRATDLKLQYYFVSKVNPGIHNHLLSGSGFDLRDPTKMLGHHLMHSV